MPDALDHPFSRAILEGNSHLALLQAKCENHSGEVSYLFSTTFLLGPGRFGGLPLRADLFKR